jgi:hypothetical protein
LDAVSGGFGLTQMIVDKTADMPGVAIDQKLSESGTPSPSWSGWLPIGW